MLSSPSTNKKSECLQVSLKGCPQCRGHAVLIFGVAILPRGLLQEVQVSIDRCFVVPRHLFETKEKVQTNLSLSLFHSFSPHTHTFLSDAQTDSTADPSKQSDHWASTYQQLRAIKQKQSPVQCCQLHNFTAPDHHQELFKA